MSRSQMNGSRSTMIAIFFVRYVVCSRSGVSLFVSIASCCHDAD
jgi:hypothetical protein